MYATSAWGAPRRSATSKLPAVAEKRRVRPGRSTPWCVVASGGSLRRPSTTPASASGRAPRPVVVRASGGPAGPDRGAGSGDRACCAKAAPERWTAANAASKATRVAARRMNSISWFRTAGIPRLDASVVARMLLAERRPGVQDRPDRHHLGTPPIPLAEERRGTQDHRGEAGVRSTIVLAAATSACREGRARPEEVFSGPFSRWGRGNVVWIVRLVSVGAEEEERSTDVMRIARPDDLADLAALGLTLAEGKRLLAGPQREIVAAQARLHAVRRPECRGCGAVCRVKDYRQHAIATLFGQVTVRLPRFRCAACATTETGVGWPPHVRSTPELDRLRARLSALMTYRTAAGVLAQLFPVDAGADPETLRRHTFKTAEALPMRAETRPPTRADAIVVTLDSTFIRSCEDGERHLEVRIGNAETETGRRQTFGAVAKADTDLGALIRRNLDVVGCTEDTTLTAVH